MIPVKRCAIKEKRDRLYCDTLGEMRCTCVNTEGAVSGKRGERDACGVFFMANLDLAVVQGLCPGE